MPSKKILEAKKSIVDEIKSKLNDSKTIILFDYCGLTDNDSRELRTQLKENASEYKIYKNTLLKLAFKDLNIDLNNYLEGPTAIVFSSDDIAAIKILSDCAKKHKTLELKAGIVEGKITDSEKLNEFAKIPSREGLYTML